MYLFIQNGSTGYFFLGIVPHGIVEIPALIIASAMGLRVGLEVFRKIFKKEGNISEELSNALEFFWKVVIPIIFLAALIEVFITANLLGV
jgi:stage II sporulation protein M